MLPGHDYVHYTLLTLLTILFRIDPPSANAALAALTIWEVTTRIHTH